MSKRTGLGLFSLLALVVGNTLGAGVFTTSGFVLDDLGSPGYVLLAWFIGGVLAMCGAVSYGALAKLMPVSGGEYYFLSRAVHPLAGFVAGWISLLAGFTGAIAFAAITLEAYLVPPSLGDVLPHNAVATGAILVAALAHGLQVRRGVWLQNFAVSLKLLLIGGFTGFALLGSDPGNWDGLQAWRQAAPRDFSLSTFALSLMWISFSYSGFNASVYVASEARDAALAVPRAMALATGFIVVLYLLLNTIFVLVPAPEIIAGREDVAALAALALAGEGFATLMRGIIVAALFTSVSAMIMTGPRVYARMAEDGLMPGELRFRGGVPSAAVAMQALLAVAVVWMAELRELLSYLGFTLSLSAAASVASLFVVVRRRQFDAAQLSGYPWAPAIFVTATLVLAALAATANPVEMGAALLTILSAVLAYYLFGGNKRNFTAQR